MVAAGNAGKTGALEWSRDCAVAPVTCQQIRPCRQWLRGERLHPASGVEELAEAESEPAPKGPPGDERDVEALSRAFRDAAIAAEDDALIARFDQLLRLHDELLPPVAVERIEDVPADVVEPPVVPAVRKPLRL